MNQSSGKSYPVGTRVQHRNGYIVVKTEDGMVAEGRRVWEITHEGLEPGDRVFHIDGDRTNNNPRNLAKVHFNVTKFVMLKESKVLWMPTRVLRNNLHELAKVGRKDLTNEVLALAKKREEKLWPTSKRG